MGYGNSAVTWKDILYYFSHVLIVQKSENWAILCALHKMNCRMNFYHDCLYHIAT